MLLPWLSEAEWLEPDGLGGFAMGTAGGVRSRRYHGLLLTAQRPPTDRVLLVSGYEAWVETAQGRFALTTQAYRHGVRHPDGERRIETFDVAPWPKWRFRLEDGTVIEHELFVPRGHAAVCLRWTVRFVPSSPLELSEARLVVRPFLAARDYHSLLHEHGCCRLDGAMSRWPATAGLRDAAETRVVWKPHAGVPAIVSWSNGDYLEQPDWYRQFLYAKELERGLDCLEDLPSPGELSWTLTPGTPAAEWLLMPDAHESAVRGDVATPLSTVVGAYRAQETARRAAFPTALHRAAADYIVQRGSGRTIIAGYPWFTDWGRDTFIALRGLCLATGDLTTAETILTSWAATVSEGMLPNRFPDHGEQPEFNAVDASLWFVIVAHEFLQRGPHSVATENSLREAIGQILDGYARGTRFGIRLDDDGLIAAGQPGVQLTWMDAKVGDWVVTPRIGKPVEVQALWLNALWLELQAARRANDLATIKQWEGIWKHGARSFQERFWNEADGCLFDLIDVDHQCGVTDASFRPNQIFAAGGLPLTLLPRDRARRVVEAVAAKLWTPLGLRSLAPDEPNYVGRYCGGVWQRDAAYHQGTAWAWLLGPFIEAWLKVHQNSADARHEVSQRFVEPLLAHLYQAGWGHISEIADGDLPQTPQGCPFQAWSLGELLRIQQLLQSTSAPAGS
jgi:predicted glycogen debranching enzyme